MARAETEYYAGIVEDLFLRWSSGALNGNYDDRQKLVRRIMTALVKLEAEIPLHSGSNFIEVRLKWFVKLFNYEARLHFALSNGESVEIPEIDRVQLSGTLEAALFYDEFRSAMIDWIQMNDLIFRAGRDAVSDAEICESQVCRQLGIRLASALNLAESSFEIDKETLPTYTIYLLRFYAQKLRALAKRYRVNIPSALDEGRTLAAEEVRVLRHKEHSEQPSAIEEFEVPDEHRRLVHAAAERIVRQSRSQIEENGEDWDGFDVDHCSPQEIHSQLVKFYRIYNISKLDEVDDIAEHYRGREKELFQALEAKYVRSGTEDTRNDAEAHPIRSEPSGRCTAM